MYVYICLYKYIRISSHAYMKEMQDKEAWLQIPLHIILSHNLSNLSYLFGFIHLFYLCYMYLFVCAYSFSYHIVYFIYIIHLFYALYVYFLYICI